MSDDILTVSGLQVSYRVGRRVTDAVHGVDFAVPHGGIVALVGESGSGKSTVSQALVRRLADNGQITGGTVAFDGIELTRLSERAIRGIRGGRIGFVPQDPNASLNPVRTIGSQMVEQLRLHRGMNRADAAARAVEILGSVGIRNPEARANQYPHELSGGMKQRVLIGMAWSCDPQLVIADEPTSALDVTVQRHVLDQIAALNEEQGTAVLLVTHDLGVAKDRADEVLVMQHGRVVDSGATNEVLGAPRTDYTRELVAAAPGLNSARITPGDDVVAKVQPTDAVMLSVSGLRKTYPQGGETFVAADEVTFSVSSGKTLALVGESGSGKTTTARMAARIIAADAGSVEIDGRDVTALSGAALRDLRRTVQVVYQNPFGSLDPRMSVANIIAEPLRAFRVGTRQEQAERVARLLSDVRLPASVAERFPAELSGGQRQRVAIARALALEPRLLVLDEPVSALDVSVQTQILQLLVDLQKELGLTYLFITHDFGVVRQIADHVVVMQSGRIVEQGAANQMLTDPQTAYAQELLAAVPGSVSG